MNETEKRGCMLLFACMLTLAFSSCKSVPAPIDTSQTDKLFVDVIETQTEVITTGKDLETTIDTIKVITDDAKVTGDIPKEKVTTLIKYVDQSSEQIKTHNEIVKTLTGKITELEKSRIDDNSINAVELEKRDNIIKKLAPYKPRFFIACAIIGFIGLLISGYIILKVKKAILF